ncbi:MAG: hypothetical protein K9I94_03875 [Bacteroidales bacterium]|nr:hypothetical protein [Bacteroidales bacterium]
MAKAEREIELLQQQIDKLGSKDFDLKAWKNYTNIILGRIFGENTQKIKQINNIEYDYSSWSLRDSTGASSNLDMCKKLGREILEASIAELQNFGLPEKDKAGENAIDIHILIEAMEDELKGSQFKELKRIINETNEQEERKKLIMEKLTGYGLDSSAAILAAVLSHQDLRSKLD